MLAGLLSDFCVEILVALLIAILAMCRRLWISLHAVKAETESINILNWSPDGQKVCYVIDHKGNREIFVYDLITENKLNLTNSPADDFSPVWSPDGKKVAFVSEQNGKREIYIVNADGSNLQRITNDPAEDICPEWSPNGERIGIISRKNVDTRISKVNLENFIIDSTN